MVEQAELGARKTAVLRAVVEEYIRTGEPVGSETIAERHGLGVSPATIRNEMASLEELGYLSHPHTSAGRIPTDLGYRRYVDSLPPGGRLREAQRRAITGFFAETMLDLEEVLKGTTKLLSRLTQYAGLAVPPSLSEEAVLRVELIEVGSGLMILVVGQHGRVEKQVVDRPDGFDAHAAQSIERRLADSFRGKTLAEARARALRLAGEAQTHERDLLLALADTLGDMQRGTRTEHVLVGGAANLADEAAHWRRETVRRLFEALERESEMLHLLRDVSADELSVTIGAEHPATGEWEAALVAAPFRAGESALGTIGVVGPTRMDYLSVMASVRAVARRLSELATELGE
ncbi:MAG: heat-inducible transcription repressor HrcA [Actinobacteria bacterium]|nr:heat-inducible transcription repressor HrcA [Actinomycetota bacterium]